MVQVKPLEYTAQVSFPFIFSVWFTHDLCWETASFEPLWLGYWVLSGTNKPQWKVWSIQYEATFEGSLERIWAHADLPFELDFNGGSKHQQNNSNLRMTPTMAESTAKPVCF